MEDKLAPIGTYFFSSSKVMGRDKLLPEEQPFVKKACKKRVGDFATGRYCARRALAGLGLPECAITVAPNRAPNWPNGIVGSITHTDGFVAAVVGRAHDYRSVGLDSQRVKQGRITPGMARLILQPSEFPLVDSGERDERLNLVFCAKESLYKCLNPLVNKFFGFECARVVSVDDRKRKFVIELTEDLSADYGKGFRLAGQYVVNEGVLTTLLYLTSSGNKC